jgi:hypothetical protein
MSVGSAFGRDPLTRDDSTRVTVGQNGYGDVLLGQFYESLFNYTTKIKVINTASDRAVVAKIVFRSSIRSCDVLDFNIYLTPTDMWEGEVRLNADGNVEIYSTDDSVLADTHYEWDGTAACNPFRGTWASEATPFQQTFYTDCLLPGDINGQGHFEVYGLASYNATPPLSKNTLALAYGQIAEVPFVDAAKLVACDFNLNATIDEDCPNVLIGSVILANSGYGDQKVAINMIALKNWNNAAQYISVENENTLNNSRFNSIAEVEACLAKTNYTVPFDFSSTGYMDVLLINTLPTRYTSEWSSYIKRSGYPGLAGGVCGLEYKVYDMEETRIMDFLSGDTYMNCLPEVSIQGLRPLIQDVVDDGYLKGWVNVIFPVSGGSGISAVYPTSAQRPQGSVYRVNYNGVPSINSYITVDQSSDLAWSYATSPESTVTYVEDVDGDGRIDAVFEDKNDNGILDGVGTPDTEDLNGDYHKNNTQDGLLVDFVEDPNENNTLEVYKVRQ